VHAIKRNNITNAANRNDTINILISPVLPSPVLGFPEDAYPRVTADAGHTMKLTILTVFVKFDLIIG
jgi:hypothetical protein